jgi:hypothetical protein
MISAGIQLILSVYSIFCIEPGCGAEHAKGGFSEYPFPGTMGEFFLKISKKAPVGHKKEHHGLNKNSESPNETPAMSRTAALADGKANIVKGSVSVRSMDGKKKRETAM